MGSTHEAGDCFVTAHDHPGCDGQCIRFEPKHLPMTNAGYCARFGKFEYTDRLVREVAIECLDKDEAVAKVMLEA